MNNKNAALLAITAASLLSTAPLMAESNPATTAVHCYGVNSCKSTNGCKSSDSCKGINSCKGVNACKGQGYVIISQEQCTKMGGTTKSADE